MEWPPQFKKIKEALKSSEWNPEDHVHHEAPAFTRAAKPEAFKATQLIKLAEAKDVAGVVAQLDTFYDGWRDYASDRNLYRSPELVALWKARGEAIQLAGAGASAALATKLTEIIGQRAQDIELAAHRNEQMLYEQKTGTKLENLHRFEVVLSSVDNETTRARLSGTDLDVTDQYFSKGALELTEKAPDRRATPDASKSEDQYELNLEPETKEVVADEPEDSDQTISAREKKGLMRPYEELGVALDNIDPNAPFERGAHDDVLELTERAPEEVTETSQKPVPSPTEINVPKAKIERAKEVVAPEYTAMEAAEAEYLEEFKSYHKKFSFKAKDGNEPESLKELNRAYNQSRAAYQTALDDSAFARIQEKVKNGELHAGKGLELLNRYNRIVTYKEVYKPAAEKRNQARLEAQGENAAGTFKKAFTWLVQKNQRAEEWLQEKTGSKTAAKFARVVGTTVVIGGGAAAAGAFATTGALAAIGWGTFRIGRTLASSAIGASAGEALAELHEKTWGAYRQQKRVQSMEVATEDLAAQSEEARQFNFTSIDDFEAYDAERERLLQISDERNLNKLEQEKMLVRLLTAVGVGAGTAGILSQLPSGLSTVETANQPPVTTTNAPQAPTAVPAPLSETGTTPSPAPVPEAHKSAPPVAEKSTPAPEKVVRTDQPSKVAPSEPVRRGESVATPKTPALVEAVGPTAEQAAPESPVTQPQPEAVESIPASTYDGPFKEVIALPEGMDPESPEAVAYLNKAYNPQFAGDTGTGQAVSEQPVLPEQVTQSQQPEVPVQPTNNPPATSLVTPESSSPSQMSTETEAPSETLVTHSTTDGTNSPVESPTSSSAESTNQDSSSTATPEATSGEASSSEAFTNSHGVEIDPKTPHLYVLDSAKDKDSLYLYGGTNEQKDKLIESFFSKPENDTKSVWITSSSAKSTFTGQPITYKITAGGGGGMVIADKKGIQIPPPAPNSFISRVQ